MVKLISILIAMVSFSFAQNVGVKVDNATDGTENTTIEIKKGTKTTPAQYEITQGEESVQGDAAPLLKEARTNWKKACDEWKKELKELNKENTVLSMNCGKQDCATQAMETVCTSKATYKLKVKVN